MTMLDEDTRLIVKTLANLAKTYPGPPHLSPGPDPETLARETGLAPDRLRDAVEHLKQRGLVNTESGVGYRPEYGFLNVKLTGAGRRQSESASNTNIGERDPEPYSAQSPSETGARP